MRGLVNGQTTMWCSAVVIIGAWIPWCSALDEIISPLGDSSVMRPFRRWSGSDDQFQVG